MCNGQLHGVALSDGQQPMVRGAHTTREDVVNHDDLAALHACADHVTALAVVLLLLPVVAVVLVAGVTLTQGEASDGRKRDALVGRAKEDVEVGLD